MEKKIAVVSAILEEPAEVQNRFNEIVAEYRGNVREEQVYRLINMVYP